MSRVAVLLLSAAASCQAGLLGAGHGEGSCAAAPPGAECCTEYGYCRPYPEWVGGNFRDCNGKSNGKPLPPDTIAAEAAAAAGGDPAALVAAPVAAYAPAPVVAAPAAPVAAPAAAPVVAAPAAPVAAY